MQISSPPYTGAEPYLFISYCGNDFPVISPILEQFNQESMRIWYDSPVSANMEQAEERLQNCAAAVVFLTEQSVLFHSCRQVITSSFLKGKPLIPVLMDSFSLPLGLQLQLQRIPCLPGANYPSHASLVHTICAQNACSGCKAPPKGLPLNPEMVPDIPVQRPTEQEYSLWFGMHSVQPPPGGRTEPVFQEQPIIENNLPPEVVYQDPPTPPLVPQPPAKEPIPEKIPEAKPDPVPQEVEDDVKTVIIPSVPTPPEHTEEEATVLIGKPSAALLLHPAAKRIYLLDKPQIKLGRSKHKCDIVISGNDSISKEHAQLRQYKQKYFLIDSNSANGTYLGAERLTAGDQVPLDNPAVFRLNDEVLILVTGEQAHKLMGRDRADLVFTASGSSACLILEDTVYLNRSRKWADGTLSDPKVHRNAHAKLCLFEGSIYLIDESPEVGNGTHLNEVRLRRGEARPLSSGDKIRLGDTILEFVSIPM